jgi:hypothetical protein
MRIPNLLLLLCVAANLVACGRSKPSNSDAKEALRKVLSENSDGLISLKSFSASNGRFLWKIKGLIPFDVGESDDFYGLDFSADIQFGDDCVYGVRKKLYENGLLLARRATAQSDLREMGVSEIRRAARGDVTKISGDMQFDKGSYDWKLTRYHVNLW